MTDFIYDQEGQVAARLVDDRVLDEATGEQIGTVRDLNIYSLDGTLVGHLAPAGAGVNQFSAAFAALLRRKA